MSTIQDSRNMAHHLKLATAMHKVYWLTRGQSTYTLRQVHIGKVCELTGQSYNDVMALVATCSVDRGTAYALDTWLGLRSAAEIEAEYGNGVEA